MATQPGTAPWPHNWNPRAGNFDTLFNTLAVALNTAGPAILGTATTTVNIPVPATKQLLVSGASVQGGAVFTSSSAVTATLTKKSGSTRTALTAAFDLTAALSSAGQAALPITASNADATLSPGDTLWVEVAAAGTVGPSTADLRVCVEVSLNF